jgi:membrane-bound ClpP family serine protease
MVILNSVPESSSNASPYMPQKRSSSLYFNIGALSGIISLFVLPEIFGSVAIILGAYTWRLEGSENRNRGLALIIFGIVAMLVGIYYTAFFGLFTILP